MATQSRWAESRKWLDQAVALRPDLGAGWLELGMLSLAESKAGEALQHFARAREFLPQDPRIPLHTAKALSQLKRPTEAIQQAQEAIKLDPAFWEAHSFLGEELAIAGRTAEAQKEFEAVLRLQPNHPLAHLNLGVALFQQGHAEDAARHFETALRLDPMLTVAKQYLQQLKARPGTSH